jgi:hypothetical protein
MLLKKVHINTGKEQQVFERIANQMVDVCRCLRVALDYLVELLAEKANHSGCSCKEDYIQRIVVSNICEMVGLLLSCCQLAVLEDAVDLRLKISLQAPVDEEQSGCIRRYLPSKVSKLVES